MWREKDYRLAEGSLSKGKRVESILTDRRNLPANCQRRSVASNSNITRSHLSSPSVSLISMLMSPVSNKTLSCISEVRLRSNGLLAITWPSLSLSRVWFNFVDKKKIRRDSRKQRPPCHSVWTSFLSSRWASICQTHAHWMNEWMNDIREWNPNLLNHNEEGEGGDSILQKDQMACEQEREREREQRQIKSVSTVLHLPMTFLWVYKSPSTRFIAHK